MITKTKHTGQTAVGQISLSALDIGFDLRQTGHAVVIPAFIKSVGYDADGDTWLATGTTDELIAELTRAGYIVSKGDDQ